MLDGSLAIKNAQKQALARESVAAGSKQDTSGTRFADFVDDARESEDDRAARNAQSSEQAERLQANQMRARKSADAGKTLVAPEPAETPRSKVPADADKDTKALPQTAEPSEPPAEKAEAAGKTQQAKDKGPTEKTVATGKAEKTDKAEKAEKSDEATDEEAKADPVAAPANLVATQVDTAQPVPVVVAAATTGVSEQKDGKEATEVEAIGDVTGSAKAAAKTALSADVTDVVAPEPTAEQLAETAKITRATQKETPKPALATAAMASEEAIPDLLQAMTPQEQPKPVPQVKVKADTAVQTPKGEAKLADKDAAAPAVSVQGDPVQPVKTAKAETEKPGNTLATDAPATESSKEPSLRADSATATPASAPQVQAAAAQQQNAAILPDPNLVPASDGSRLSLTPSTQQAAPSAATLTSGPLVPLNQVAVSIATKAMGGSTRFDIRLDPPELGRIDVRLTMDREGRVKSTMVIEKRETYELMQRDQRGLETAMQQAGLKMNEGSVEFTLRDPSSNGQQNNAGNLFGDREGRSGQRPVLDDPRAEQGTTETTTIQMYASLAQQRGGVDLRI